MKPTHSSPARWRSPFASVSGIGVLVAALAVTPPVSPLHAVHIGLASSVPAKGAHLMTAPTEIRLTFTGTINVAKAGIELLGPDSAQVATDSLRAVADSVRVAVTKISGKLTGGTYTVKWKAVAADGAAGSGSFNFMYMPSEERLDGRMGRKP